MNCEECVKRTVRPDCSLIVGASINILVLILEKVSLSFWIRSLIFLKMNLYRFDSGRISTGLSQIGSKMLDL